MGEKSEKTPRYQELKKPEFKSQIPAHLVDKLDTKEKYLVETLSRMEQQQEWLINSQLETNRAVLETDLRMQTVEEWKTMVTYKASTVIALAVIVIPMFIERILGLIWPVKKP